MKREKSPDSVAGTGRKPRAPAPVDPAGVPAPTGGLRKAAVFVLSLEESVASDLLQRLGDEELERLTAEIANLGVVEQDTLSSVLEEFHDLTQLHGVLKEGGLDQAIRLVERSFPPERSRRLTQLLEAHRPHLPLAFLSRAETDSLLRFLESEHPQTVAVILAHMSPSKAAEVLGRMDERKQQDLIRRVARLKATSEEVIRELEKSLRKYIDAADLVPSAEQRGGVETAVDILRASGDRGRGLLNELRHEEPGLVDELSGLLFAFEDLSRLDMPSLQRVLEEVSARRLATALKSAPGSLTEAILRNLSGESSELLRAEMEILGPVRMGDVESARQAVVDTVLNLEERGAVYIEGRGAREDRLVY